MDFLQLIDQKHRGIAIGRKISGLNLDLQRFGIAVAELLHDLPGFRDVLFGVGPYPVSDDTISGGIPHSPTGCGSMAPPISASPSIKTY